MSDKNTKTMLLGTLTLVLCSIIIGVFCILPNNEVAVELKSYEVLFDTSGGSLIAAIKIDEGGKIEIPEEPTREGYVFDGWLLNGESFDFSTQVSGDITLIASWKEVKPDAKYFKVSFDTGGGTEFDPISIEEGENAFNPGEPMKDGYEFVEWRYNGKAFNFETPITKDITLVAYYKKSVDDPSVPKYVVKFDTNGGSGTCANQNVKEGSKAKTPTCKPTKKGYTLVGWNTSKDATSSNIGNVKITEDTTFYAIFTETKYYTVTFNSKGGSECASQKIESGKSPKDCTSSYPGYKFGGWATSANSTTKVNITKTPITKDTTYHAIWIPLYNISFNTDGGSSCNAFNSEKGSTFKISSKCNPSKKYYTLSGWLDGDGSNYKTSSSIKVSGNMILKAKWTKMSFTVKYQEPPGVNLASTCKFKVVGSDNKNYNEVTVYKKTGNTTITLTSQSKCAVFSNNQENIYVQIGSEKFPTSVVKVDSLD